MPRKTKNQTPAPGLTLQPLPVGIDSRQDNGRNDHEPEFSAVWRMVMANYQNFSPELFLSLTRSLDLDQQEVRSLTKKFIKHGLDSGQIAQIESCMDSPVYRIV